ncbi:MAG: nucleotidyltransferase [Planctomycetota bacterium]|nr:MAG: nucleotidyltransferase [Planctomycetota bacterium]
MSLTQPSAFLLHPLFKRVIFRCIIGSRAYGLDDDQSDTDYRGIFLPTAEQHWSLNGVPEHIECYETQEHYWELQRFGEETVEKSGMHDGLEIDLVTHDAKKFFGLMLKKNGYVLEQLLSPLIVQTSPEHEELKAIAPMCITRHHAHHYLGFAETQWNLFLKTDPPHVKPLLYVYRVLLTGIHLMRTGQIEANLVRLNEDAQLPYIPDLIARKTGGPEKGRLEAADLIAHAANFICLKTELKSAFEQSRLPDGPAPTAAAALNDLLCRVRLTKGAHP